MALACGSRERGQCSFDGKSWPEPVTGEQFYCFFIYDLLRTSYNTNTRMSTLQHLQFQKVDIFGTVVATWLQERTASYVVDDGSGQIRCCLFHRDSPAAPVPPLVSSSGKHAAQLLRPTLGTQVHVRGRLGEFRNAKEVVIYKLRIVTDCNEEATRVMFQLALYRNEYNLLEEPKRKKSNNIPCEPSTSKQCSGSDDVEILHEGVLDYLDKTWSDDSIL